MVTFKLRYGRDHVSFEAPPGIRWRELRGPALPAKSEQEIVDSSLSELRSELLQNGVKKGARILLVVPDHTRRCRLEMLLPPLAVMLEGGFSAGIEALVASGTHQLQSPQEIAELVGEDFSRRYPVVQHDCNADPQMEAVGVTSRGTPVTLNRKLLQADLVITIGGVLFHYFAGFGGGPKMIFPGLAGYESVYANHSLSLDLEAGRLHPGCRECELDSNPVYQDLAEAAQMAPAAIVSWQLLIDAEGMIRHAETGPLLPTHRRIARHAEKLFGIPINGGADLVVASAGGHPVDVDLIQSHKAIHHAFAAVKPGGWIVMLAACPEGIGSRTFMDYFSESTAAGIARRLRQDYRLNGQTALALKSKTESAHIVLVSGLDPTAVSRTGMIPAAGIAEAWEIVARDSRGAVRAGYLFPQAAFHLPRISS